MANFLNTHALPKLKPEDLNSLNRAGKSSKTEAVAGCPSTKKSPGSDDRFTAKFYHFHRSNTNTFLLFYKTEMNTAKNTTKLYESSIILILKLDKGTPSKKAGDRSP